MATDIRLTRGVRRPASRDEGGKVVNAGEVITDASLLSRDELKAMAEKGYVAGMEPEPEAAEGKPAAGRGSRKGK